MRLIEENNKLFVFIDNPRLRKPHRLDISSLINLPRREISILIEATGKCVIGKRHSTQEHYFRGAVSQFGRYLESRDIRKLPKGKDEWQYLLIDWCGWHLRQEGSNATLTTRINMWENPIVPWINILISEDIISEKVTVPRANIPTEIVTSSKPRHPSLLGQEAVKETDPKRPINKTLAGPIYWLSDEKYLDGIETTLLERNKLLKEILDSHWAGLIRDQEAGDQLMHKITDDEYAKRVETNNWIVCEQINHCSHTQKIQLVTNPKHDDSESWALKIMSKTLQTSNEEKCLSRSSLRQHPALPYAFLNENTSTPLKKLIQSSSLDKKQLKIIGKKGLYARFLGLLSPVDIAVAIAILMQEHPNLNATSLASAKLLNSRGKSYLFLSDNKTKETISVDKPRANSRKYAPLTPRAAWVIKHVMQATCQVRNLLKRSGSKHWRYLFLGFSAGAWNHLGLPYIHSSLLTGEEGVTLVRLYPELAKKGLRKGTLDFSKIRTTQGVLEWFNSGSIVKVSQKLGNSRRVVLEHYIPEPLLKLWNERIIRRFQNTLILTATSDEDYFQEVTDLRNHSELHNFVAQIICENPSNSSPIGDLLNKKFSGIDDHKIDNEAILSIRLDGNALALLYAYKETAKASLTYEELKAINTKTGISPMHLINLAEFLSHAAENTLISESLREHLDISKLRYYHRLAQPKVSEIATRLANPGVEY